MLMLQTSCVSGVQGDAIRRVWTKLPGHVGTEHAALII